MDLLRQNQKTISQKQFFKIFEDCLAGMWYLKGKGLFVGDLRPENVMVVE